MTRPLTAEDVKKCYDDLRVGRGSGSEWVPYIDHTFQLASRYFRGKYQIATIERHWNKIVRILRAHRGF